MQTPKDINLIYRAGQLAGMALTFADGELESLMHNDALNRAYRDMAAASFDYRERLLSIKNGPLPALSIDRHIIKKEIQK